MSPGSLLWSRPRTSSHRGLRHALARHRRWVVALLLGAAVVTGLASLAPPRPTLHPVVVAAHDLAAGVVLTADDLVVIEASDARPDGALSDAAALPGRSVAAPMRKGEPFTDVRLVGPALLAGTTGLVAYPVRLADAEATALVRPGDLVDVLAAQAADVTAPPGASPITAQVVAGSVRVLAVPPVADGSTTGTSGNGFAAADGTLVVLAVTPSTALALAGASAAARLSVSLLRTDDTSGFLR